MFMVLYMWNTKVKQYNITSNINILHLFKGALLITWFNFDASMDKWLHQVWDDMTYAFSKL